MKKLFLIVALIVPLMGKSQVNIDNIWSAGSKWVETYLWDAGQYSNYTKGASYTIMQDSIINGISYRLLSGKYLGEISGKIPGYPGNPSNPDSPSRILGGIRVDGKKVYFFRTADVLKAPGFNLNYSSEFQQGVEELIYDFDLEVGDTLTWKTGKNIVLTIDSALLSDNKYARRFHFDTMGPDYSYWIEGIGSNVSMLGSELYNFLPKLPWNGGETQCYDNSSFYYRFSGDLKDGCFYVSPNHIDNIKNNENQLALYPNPLTGDELQIDAQATITLLTITDINGRIKYSEKKLSSGKRILNVLLAPGVYFVQLQFEDGTIVNKKLVKQ